MSATPLRLAVLLSGGGRTLQNFIDLKRANQLPIDIPLVIGSKPDLYGLERAKNANVPHIHVVSRKDHPTVRDFSNRIFSLCDQHEIDLVALAGWLSLLDIPDRFNDRIMNIHPALLPAFGGKGMFGHHVHQAVLDAGCKVSGCTVHFCDNTYDTGPIILQRTCPVQDDDTPDSLARRVFEQETLAYPQAIRLYADRRLKIEGRRVRILPQDQEPPTNSANRK
jgi:formyltetrahydrofolate-dependent phosphoribosylglycinamide formyltransferase